MSMLIHCDKCDETMARTSMEISADYDSFFLSCPFCGDIDNLRDATDGALLDRLETHRRTSL